MSLSIYPYQINKFNTLIKLQTILIRYPIQMTLILNSIKQNGPKHVAHRSVEEILLSSRQYSLFTQLKAWEQSRIVKKVSNSGFGRPLELNKMNSRKSSDTLFILGSGSSIDEISDRKWSIIDENDSIGLNRWAIHPFMPTYYVFEPPIHKKTRTELWELFEYKYEELKHSQLIMKDVNRLHGIIEADEIPKRVRDMLYISGDFELPPYGNRNYDKQFFVKFLRFLKDNGYLQMKYNNSLLFRKTASISYLLFFAKLLGYSNIILCGVDMNDSKYFFHNEKYLESAVPIPGEIPKDSDSIHRTADPTRAGIPLDEVIYTINDVILQPCNISLYVESEGSKLNPTIPTYWDKIDSSVR